MTRRQILTLILCTWALTGVAALLLHFLTRGGAEALLGEVADWPHLTYALSLTSVMVTILSCYYLLRYPRLGALLRAVLLASPLALALAYYYLFMDSGLLACLPVLGVVSVMMLAKAEI